MNTRMNGMGMLIIWASVEGIEENVCSLMGGAAVVTLGLLLMISSYYVYKHIEIRQLKKSYTRECVQLF